jgi:hypothetical protein
MDAYSNITWFFRNLWKILTFFIVITLILIKYFKSSSYLSILALFSNLEGTALLGAAFSPQLEDLCANGGFKKFISNCTEY